MLAEPEALLREAIEFCSEAPEAVPLVSRVFTRKDAEAYLLNAVR